MHAGQEIGVHSDRPYLGYEMARLIVQLNKDWQAAHGGVLELFESQEGQAVAHVKPRIQHGTGLFVASAFLPCRHRRDPAAQNRRVQFLAQGQHPGAGDTA